jgi:hypothetical protein
MAITQEKMAAGRVLPHRKFRSDLVPLIPVRAPGLACASPEA